MGNSQQNCQWKIITTDNIIFRIMYDNLKECVKFVDFNFRVTAGMALQVISPGTNLSWVYSTVQCACHITRISCQKGPTRHAYAWQIAPFWQDILDKFDTLCNTSFALKALINDTP